MAAVVECRRGCGFAGLPHHVATHERVCLIPRSLPRLCEIGGVEKQGDEGCWLWRGIAHKRGVIEGRRAYIVAYEIDRGVSVPPDRLVCHHCDTPGCIRPSHLFTGTVSDNARDMAQKGRTGGAATWTREQRLAAGLDGSKARAARLARRRRDAERAARPMAPGELVELYGR